MIVEPYNFALSFNNIVRSSSMISTFSNEQTIAHLEQFSHHSYDQYNNQFSQINSKLADCFNSIFSTENEGSLRLQDICRNICACPQINQALISNMKVTGQDYEEWLRTFYNNENLLYSYLTSKKKQYLNYQINSVGKFMSDQLKDAKRNKGLNFKDDNWQKKQLGIVSELQTERDK